MASLPESRTLDVPITLTPTPAPEPQTMAERVDAEIEANPLGHEWVAHSTISIDFKTAKRASFRGSFRTQEAGIRIDALDVVCHTCRRPFDAVSGEARCAGKIDNEHLIGGDLAVRAKRIIHEPQGTIIRHVIDRRGMSGYSVHAGK